MIKTAIMGHGTVGSGVAEILINKCFTEKVGDGVEVKYILDLRNFDGLSYSDKFIKDFSIIRDDPEVKIVAEVMGGLNPAYDFVKECLERGKSVVTSNKELVAAKGDELLKIAKQNNVSFLFEASVGGGIPIIRPLAQCLAANDVQEITGILNGTTNYILNKMIVDNMDFDTALKLAQDMGFAEKNPAADIEGHDACRKVCILASLAFGKHIYPEQVETEGITEITLDDVAAADSFNCVIKLIGNTRKLDNGKITATVRPTLVSRDNIISGVNGVFNAVMVKGDAVGDVMFYGQGAGKMATASAVVADILDCAKNLKNPRILSWGANDPDFVVKSTDKERFFVSVRSDDFEGLKAAVDKGFGDASVVKNGFSGEIAILTAPMLLEELEVKIAALNVESYKILHTIL